MSRLIDADALKTLIAEHVYPVRDDFNNVDYGMFWTGGIEKAINEMPTVEERKTGKWNMDGFCTVCGEEAITEWNDCGGELAFTKYCPNCGARMEE